MWRSTLALTLTLALTGCASLTTPSDPVVRLTPVKVREADLARCPDLPLLEGSQAKQVTPWAVDVVTTYNDCAEGKDKLIDLVRAHNAKAAGSLPLTVENPSLWQKIRLFF
jgi:hypothetical protein